jgi:CheY-like chemotaxis protein
MKILTVEDDPINLKLINIILSSNGYELLDAVNGGTALEKIKKEKPDLILLDLNLPDMSGTEVAAKIKNDKQTSGIPIVAITSYPDKYGNREVVSSGFDAYLVKPLNTRVLVEIVEGLLPLDKNENVN